MKTKLDWSKAKQNKFAKGTRPVTIRMDVEDIQWLVAEAKRQGLRGYQTLAKEIISKAHRESEKNVVVYDPTEAFAQKTADLVIEGMGSKGFILKRQRMNPSSPAPARRASAPAAKYIQGGRPKASRATAKKAGAR